jgi:hypothetical protein
MRVFEQEKLIGDFSLFSRGHQFLLQFQRRCVVDASEFPQLAATH